MADEKSAWQQHCSAIEVILTSEKTAAGRQHKDHIAVAEEKLAESAARWAQGKPKPVRQGEYHEAFTAPPPVLDFTFSKCLDSANSHKDKFHYVEPHDTEARKTARSSSYKDHFPDRPVPPKRILREKHNEFMKNAVMTMGSDVSNAINLDKKKGPPHQRHGETGKYFAQGRWHLKKILPQEADPERPSSVVLHQQHRFNPRSKLRGSREGMEELHIDRQTGRPIWPLSAREIQPYTTEHQAGFPPRKPSLQSKEHFKFQHRGLKAMKVSVYDEPMRSTIH